MTNQGLRKAVSVMLLLIIVGTLTPRLSAQEAKKDQEPVLKLRSELVNVRAVVTDKNGAVVDNLRKEDFEVLENGRPQEVSFFSLEKIAGRTRLPITATPDPTKKPPSAAPTPSSATSSTGRTVVLFVDTVNLTIPNARTLKSELQKFVNSSLGEQDQVALLTTTSALGVLEQFTRDRQVINRAIERLKPWQPETRTQFFTPFLAARVLNNDPEAKQLALCILNYDDGLPCRWDAANNPRAARMNPADENRINARARGVLLQAVQRRKMTLSTLRAVAERMQELPGQKILALFSDGFSMLTPSGQPDTAGIQSVVSRAARAGVVIYSFDTQGLKADAFADASFGTFMPPPAFSSYMSFSSREYENGINALAADTGGKALFNTNNLNLGLERALDENSVYYALDYYPSDDTDTNKFREIKVRVKNHPEYKVRAQRGYLPADFNREEQPLTARQRLIKAMTGLLPATTIGVAATAKYLEAEGDAAQVSLAIHADANTFEYATEDSARAFDVELAVAVLDADGKLVKTINEQIKGALTTGQFEMAKRNGYKYAKRLELAPGIYNIRVGLMETRTERVGTAIAWVEVPDLKKGGLTLSDLLLVNAAPQPKEQADVLQRVSRQGEPVFKSVDVLSCLFKIYNASDVANLQVQTEFARDGQAVFQTAWVAATTLMDDRDSKGINVSQQFKLNSLKPGEYQLVIRVRDTKKKRTTQSETTLLVEP